MNAAREGRINRGRWGRDSWNHRATIGSGEVSSLVTNCDGSEIRRKLVSGVTIAIKALSGSGAGIADSPDVVIMVEAVSVSDRINQ